MTVPRCVARLVTAGVLTATATACDVTSDSACSMAYVVTYHHTTYQASIVWKRRPFRHTRPLGVGTLATCHPDDPPQTVRVSVIPGVEPSIALATPGLPRQVLLSVPPAKAPQSIRSHLRFRSP